MTLQVQIKGMPPPTTEASGKHPDTPQFSTHPARFVNVATVLRSCDCEQSAGRSCCTPKAAARTDLPPAQSRRFLNKTCTFANRRVPDLRLRASWVCLCSDNKGLAPPACFFFFLFLRLKEQLHVLPHNYKRRSLRELCQHLEKKLYRNSDGCNHSNKSKLNLGCIWFLTI